MAQGYERKDNRPKMCFKGIWTKDHHMKDFTPDFCPSIFFFYFRCSFFWWDSFHFFLSCLRLFFSCLCFSCVCTFPLLARWVQYFSFEHQNLIVHDLEKTLLVLASNVEGNPWSGLMKEIIRLKRGPLADNFKSVKG